MIPLRDNIPSQSTPVVNYLVILCTSVVFLLQLMQQPGAPELVEQYGMIPARVENPEQPIPIVDRELVRTPRGLEIRERERIAADTPIPPVWTLFTCILLHGGWMHFLGNMLFLYIFGDNVEDRLGHVKYLLFYCGTGVAASAAHLLASPGSTIPTVGASGAIAGVMGAYFLLYPHAKVLTLIPIIFFFQIVVIPAPIFLGIWFLLQTFQGAFAITSTQAGGVAWWAHIGGFVVGFLVTWVLRLFKRLRPHDNHVLPHTEQITHYRLGRHHNQW